MSTMVYGSAGGGGGWVDITDSVTAATGKTIDDSDSNKITVKNSANGAYITITDFEAGDHFRVTGFRNMSVAFLDSNNSPIFGAYTYTAGSAFWDSFGRGYSPRGLSVSATFAEYAPIEFVVPKLSTIASIMVSHQGVYFGSTADDVKVEKYIG